MHQLYELKSNSDRNKTLSVEKYLNKIRPYLKNIINNLEISATWKIQLTIANNFILSIADDEERLMHSKNDNIEIMMNDEAYEVIKKLFVSLKNKYQNNLESVKDSGLSLIVFSYSIINVINKPKSS